MPRWVSARLACALAAAVAAATVATAETYPARPIKIIIGFGPGSSTDVTSRVLGQKLGQALGQQFVIEPHPGAASSIAAGMVARAPADGYTLFMGTSANTINAALNTTLNFDFTTDFAPIALVGSVPNILVASPSIGVRSVKDLIALAKSKPDQILFGSSGIGTSPHLSRELMNIMAGIRMVHVPYPSGPQAVTDLLGGRIHVLFSPASNVMPHVEQGKLVALASTQSARAGVAPDLPTMSEAGLPGFDTGVWFGLLAPAGTPPEIVARLAAATVAARGTPEVAETLRNQGIDALGGGQKEFADYLVKDVRRWTEVAHAAGLKK
jgi:tripartite-type tricarboxylate transporter receptor subunit TctC